MDLHENRFIHGFTVNESRDIPEINGTAYIMRHEASRARLLYLKNDDPDKAFSISFKTVPGDSTGVFHILEHSVLCGSRKFPVKEPFVNLLKASMQTFLNAMTFPDKTMYPVASTNEQDLLNMMDVYMDAVLHPAIYVKPEIFMQEGWHYERTGERSLAHNGVVFNEMKGVLSDPESVLADAMNASLFPDIAYRFESGGDPKEIVELTYEHFLEEHARHYRLDNAYIILYGNMSIERFLSWLDERYLGAPAVATNAREEAQLAAEARAAAQAPCGPRDLPLQQPVRPPARTIEMDTARENSMSGLGFVAGDVSDPVRITAADILLDAIAGSSEAPLRRALIEADLADDVRCTIMEELRQPYAFVELQGLHENAAERFPVALRSAVERILDDGLDRNLVEAAISHAEFVMREHDFGYSDGVTLSMAALSGWLYDDALSTTYLEFGKTFAELHRLAQTDYFSQLAREIFLENDHCAQVTLIPKPGDKALDWEAQRLARVADALDDEGFRRIDAELDALRAAQERPDSPEALATLPCLHLSDLAEPQMRPESCTEGFEGVRILRHTMPTNGIVYAARQYSLNSLAFEDLPYASLLCLLLGQLGTDEHSAAEIDTMQHERFGALRFTCEMYPSLSDPCAVDVRLVSFASALDQKVTNLVELVDEIACRTSFSDAERIRMILTRGRVRTESAFISAGHTFALQRLESYFSPIGLAKEATAGVDFYRFVKGLLTDFDAGFSSLRAKLESLQSQIFSAKPALLSIAGAPRAVESYLRLWKEQGLASLAEAPTAPSLMGIPEPVQRNEAFCFQSDVVFGAAGYNANLLDSCGDYAYSGSWAVASRMLSYDYLWNEVRVKGGAYGVGFQPSLSGLLRFYSYRDPHLSETLQRFADSPAWLSDADFDESEFEGYIISCVSSIDNPRKPIALMRIAESNHIMGVAQDRYLHTRREVLAATPKSVAACAPYVEAALGQGARCVFGSRQIIEASAEPMQMIDLMGE